MKNILLAFLLLAFTTSFAAEVFNYKLKGNQKYENSYSVNFADEATLHLVVVRNKDTKNYDVLPFYMNKSGEVNQMASASFEDKPEIISSHKAGTTVTLVMYHRKNLTVADFDLNSASVVKETIQLREKPENIITKTNQSIIVIPDLNGKTLEFLLVKNSQKMNKKTAEIPEDFQKDIKKIFTNNPDIINTEEFVQNGSIGTNQVYYENGNFIIINDEKADGVLKAFMVNPEGNEPMRKSVFTTTTNLDKIKDGNSYLKDNKLFGMFLGKEDFGISIFDVNTGVEEKSILLSEDISQIESADNTQAYMKGATKSKMKPTISVNITKNSNYKVTVDYVDSSTYTYYNWMWMHQMMMQQQQMMMQQNMMRPGGFGPNPANFEMDVLFKENNSVSLNFTLDKDLTILRDNNDETKYQFVDKEELLKQLKENKEIKNISAGFLENEYRYLYTDKKEETIFIANKEIIRNY